MSKIRASLVAVAAVLGAHVAADAEVPTDAPLASVDLTTTDGTQLFDATWRYSDVRIVDAEFRAPDADGQPTGNVVATYDVTPHAGASSFDDSTWSAIAPERLKDRRGNGRVSFNWYRVRLTVPEHIGAVVTTGGSLVFETALDDYAEVWVDGELPRAPAQSGGSVVKGWNAPNRLVVARHVKPGQQIQLAVFGMNGPVSAAPTNFIWMHEAKLDFYPASHPVSRVPFAVVPQEVNVTVTDRTPDLDALLPANLKVWKLAEGFTFTEGPVWTRDGALLFSDPNENRIYRYSERAADTGTLVVEREQSGYAGADIGEYGQPGSNGLSFSPDGRLTINEHGNHRVTRLERDGTLTVLTDRFEGHRLNSPNDLVYRSDGVLYFTDPPFGLPKFFDDPRKELAFSGVYRLDQGKPKLLAKELTGPNGIAFSPDETMLYVSNWDAARKVVMQYPVRPNGDIGTGSMLFDMAGAPEEEALDGLKVDAAGNLWVSGPGGVWVISPHGKHLGTIRLPKLPANFVFGGADGRTLYFTARSALYRMPVLIAGATHQNR
jgi:gluconolactonase